MGGGTYYGGHVEVRGQLVVSSLLHHAGPTDGAKVVRLGSERIYLLSHVTSPVLLFESLCFLFFVFKGTEVILSEGQFFMFKVMSLTRLFQVLNVYVVDFQKFIDFFTIMIYYLIHCLNF